MPTKNPFKDEIQQLQATLAELEADTVELQRLHDERAAQVSELATSRDFARRAELEGQRAAFEKMLEGQRGEVQRTRDALAALEQEAERDSKLSRIGELSRTRQKAREQSAAQLVRLRDELAAVVGRVLAEDHEQAGLSAYHEWLKLARELGVNLNRYGGDEEGSKALYAELEARGVDTRPLRAHVGGFEIQGGAVMPPVSVPPSEAPHAALLLELAGEIRERIRDAQNGVVVRYSGEGAPALSSLQPLPFGMDAQIAAQAAGVPLHLRPLSRDGHE